ncbi:unnamed protein product [Moneuplotes crassus]|uniref:protein-tyrosine-phosphatase n=1 Tax=Euplotes crassus TaxID=5936 RepID=A0AAD1UM37_EUPCR|nr:unnamed protein product [Moneuplotes crassus]
MEDQSSVKLQTANAQELYNYFQVYGNTLYFKQQILILDFRPSDQFELCHLVSSINIPLEKCLDSDFTSFKESRFLTKFCHSEKQKERFKKRKRLLVFMVVCNKNCDQLLEINSSLLAAKNKGRKSLGKKNDLKALKNAIMMQSILVKDRHRDCYLLKSGMNVFQDKYPFLCAFEGRKAHTVADCGRYPSEIFEAFLYLSNCKVAKDADLLQTLGITHILNVSDNVPNYFEENYLGLKYSNIEIDDVEDAPIEDYFEKAYNIINKVLTGEDEKSEDSDKCCYKEEHYSDEFDTQTLKLDLTSKTIDLWENCEIKRTISSIDLSIEDAHKKNPNSRILVHCAMGRSRSPTIVIMYIMKRFELPFEIAFKLVLQRREKIDINPGFIEKLKQFEADGFKFSTESAFDSSDSTEAGEVTPNASLA